jgi:presenilin 1
MYDFVALASCFLVILIGLSATLLVVSVFRKAIPALPVSIGLGVMFYLLTRLMIMPYTGELSSTGVFI